MNAAKKWNGNIDVKILLENGADIHAKDNDGKIIIIILTHCYPPKLFLTYFTYLHVNQKKFLL